MAERPPLPRWVAGAEVALVFALILAYTWLLRGRGPAVAVIVLLVLASHVRRGETPAALGFRREGFGRCVRAYGWVVALLGLAIAGPALRHGLPDAVTPARAAAVLGGYVAWGLVQQWALNGYVVNRLAEAFGGWRHGRWLAALVGALCFAAAHLPNRGLVGPTFVLGFLAALAWLRQRNLLFLGLAHGVLGALLVLYVASAMPQGLRTGPGALPRGAGRTPGR